MIKEGEDILMIAKACIYMYIHVYTRMQCNVGNRRRGRNYVIACFTE